MNTYPYSLDDFNISALSQIVDLPKDFVKKELLNALMIHELRYKRQSFIRGKCAFHPAYVHYKTINIYENPLTAARFLVSLARKITKPVQAEEVFCEICIVRLVYDIGQKKHEDFNHIFSRYPRAAVSSPEISDDTQKQIKEHLDSAELWIIRTLANEVKALNTWKIMYSIFVKKDYIKTGDYVLLTDHYDAPSWMKKRITKEYTDVLAAYTKPSIVDFFYDELSENKKTLSVTGKIALLSCAEKHAFKQKSVPNPLKEAVTHTPHD